MGSVAPVRHADKPTLTPGGVLSSIGIPNVNNRERWTPFALAAERRPLHLITGRLEWCVKSERRAGCGRGQPFNFAGRLAASAAEHSLRDEPVRSLLFTACGLSIGRRTLSPA
jgi:hypothetical protein